MTDQVIDIILQARAPHLHLLDFLVGREINFLFDAINRVVQPMILIEHGSEMSVASFEAPNHFTMLRKLSQDGMMKIHMVRRRL